MPPRKASAGKFETDYTKFLKRGSLKGARIGVARDFFGQSEETDAVMESAIAKLKELGATVVDPVNFPDCAARDAKGPRSQLADAHPNSRRRSPTICATLKPGYPRTLDELVAKAEDPATGYRVPWKARQHEARLAARHR